MAETKEEKILYIATCAGDNPEKAAMPFVMANAAMAMEINNDGECLQAARAILDHLAVAGHHAPEIAVRIRTARISEGAAHAHKVALVDRLIWTRNHLRCHVGDRNDLLHRRAATVLVADRQRNCIAAVVVRRKRVSGHP